MGSGASAEWQGLVLHQSVDESGQLAFAGLSNDPAGFMALIDAEKREWRGRFVSVGLLVDGWLV